jgi:TetR/AcrR family transcriptional regulator
LLNVKQGNGLLMAVTVPALPSTDRERNGARTREAVLDAAEALFAERGYEATSLGDIGASAGVSRGTPGYFFGSKLELYRAVLERCLEQVRSAVRSGRERVRARAHHPADIVAGVVGEYFEFITANPNFVRLMEWEALGGGRHLREVPPHVAAATEAVSALAEELELSAGDPREAPQLLLSIIGMSWFPLVHSSTVLAALGLDPLDPGFLEERKRHVVSLVLRGLGHSESSLPQGRAV